ncbi:MAG: cytochrome d ubiquinol oxidase subunit II [Deltaproteobacteria bacterium]|nr:cytochrome d ubiquinol oxidase subunit II [Deltaproteobacteria bacterium]
MTALQLTWFVLIGVLLGGYSILDGFDLGVGCWHLFGRDDRERRLFISAIGPVWDGNEVWLLAGGGALFAAFPAVYASVFSGLYLALMLVLVGLILRAAAIEFRSQVESPAWRRAWDVAFAVGSALPALLFGVALGNAVRGLELDAGGNYVGGFVALLNPYALLVGATGLTMFALHGALFLAARLDGEPAERARGRARRTWIVFALLFVVATGWTLAFHVRGSLSLAIAASILALLGIVGSSLLNRRGRDLSAFLSSAAAMLCIWGGVGAALFPNLVPARNDPALSLTIANSSSSPATLSVMLVIALVGLPLVIGYTAFIYRTFMRGPLDVGPGY